MFIYMCIYEEKYWKTDEIMQFWHLIILLFT